MIHPIGNASVLVVEGNPVDRKLLCSQLEGVSGSFQVHVAGTLTQVTAAVHERRFDAILLDLGLPDSRGLETLERVQAKAPDSPIVVLVGHGDDQTAVQVIRAGAQDCLVKGRTSGALVARAIWYAIERHRVQMHSRRLKLLLRILCQVHDLPPGGVQLEPLLDAACHRLTATGAYVAASVLLLDESGRVASAHGRGDWHHAVTAEELQPGAGLPGCLTSCLREEVPVLISAEHAAGCPLHTGVSEHACLATPVRVPGGHPAILHAILPASIACPFEEIPIFQNIAATISTRLQSIARERTLNAELDRAQRYLDLAELMLVALDSEGRVTLANRKACQLLGRTPVELAGVDWFECCVPAQDRDAVRRIHAGLLEDASHPLRRHESMIVTPDGETRLIDWRNTIIHDSAGEPAGALCSGVEVTEERRTEAELADTARALEAIFNSVVDGIVLADPEDGGFLRANDAMCHLLGYTATEIRHLRMEDIHPPESLPEVRQALALQLSGRQPIATDIPLLLKNGSILHADVNARPLDFEGRRLLLGVFRDVTWRHVLDTERRDRLRLLEHLDRINELLASARTPDQLLPELLAVLLEALGCDRAWLISIPLDGTGAVPVRFEQVRSRFPGASQTGEALPIAGAIVDAFLHSRRDRAPVSWQASEATRRRDDLARKYQVRSSLAMGIQPDPGESYLLGVHQCDRVREWSASERQLLQETAIRLQAVMSTFWFASRLQESESRFRTFFEHEPGYCFMLSRDGRVLDANRSALQALGYTREQLHGRPLVEMIHPPEERRRALELLRALPAGPVRDEQLMVQTQHGSRRTVLMSATAVAGPDGQPHHAIVVHRDITERLDLERQLRQSQKLEAVGRLAGGVAHDFNNLLMAMLGYCELAQELAPRGDRLDRCFRRISECGDRAGRLIRQLMAFSRRQILEPRVLDLNDLVRSLTEMLRRLLGEDITLSLHMERGLAPVRADPGQLEQVLVNLAINAREAMAQGGTLTIRTANATDGDPLPSDTSASGTVPHILLTMTDTGCGMDESTTERAFEPFFTTRRDGSGLGLATSLGIIEQSGGTIQCRSTPGQGTTFTIRLPACAVDPVAAPPAPVTPTRATGYETVLVVEDEEAVRELVVAALEGGRYRVLAAANSGEAIKSSQEHDGVIHLLLTDVVMPGMSGKTLAEILLEQRPDLRVLFISGYSAEVLAKHGVLEAGINLLEKPFTLSGLRQKVREVLSLPA
jgi:PAS domain S-box-containing protein